MKLPPNRRCINCNSMGPQYVCTTFWTFICITCSGIHREFTHRVKSVSMAKFTSQEVDALQNGGNQRAREIYLTNWDFQRQRLPDNSNVDKIREFIKIVYVDRRYAEAKSSERPPRNVQSPVIHDDEIRRASSYHSYSQSPPYDNQYEDRRYGKQAGALTRKPGSDKVRYDGKISSIIYSPGRLSDHISDERFANERSGPRMSDFSVSSGYERFKSDAQSPKFHKDVEFSSPSYQRSGSSSSEDVWSQAKNASLETNAGAWRNSDGIHRVQSASSLQPTDNNLSTLRSYNSGGLVDFYTEPVQPSGSLQTKALGIPRPSGPTRSVSMDLSTAPVVSASSVDLFQLPTTSSQAPLADLFQLSDMLAASSLKGDQLVQTPKLASTPVFGDHMKNVPGVNSDVSMPNNEGWVTLSDMSAAPSFNVNQHTQKAQVALVPIPGDLMKHPLSVPSNTSIPKNEGWATFDMPQGTPSTAQVEVTDAVPSMAESLQDRFNTFSTLDANMQWPSFETSSFSGPSDTSNILQDGDWNGEKQVSVTDTQPWNAFEDSGAHFSVDVNSQGLQLHSFPPADNQILGLSASENQGPDKDGIQGVVPIGGFDNVSHEFPAHGDIHPIGGFDNHDIPSHGDNQPNGVIRKSTNPFDYPFDSDVDEDQSNMFLDMSSLQAALPDPLLPATFHAVVAEPWLPHTTVNPYISSAGEGGLSFMAVQTPSPQLQNIQEPVASFGGNPFA